MTSSCFRRSFLKSRITHHNDVIDTSQVRYHRVSVFQEEGFQLAICIYPETFNISSTLVGNEIDDHSDVVGASHAGAAHTTTSFST